MKLVLFFTYLLGVGLPALETFRRGLDHWFVHTMTMAGDYIMGALLLTSALCFLGKKAYANLLLVISWSYVLGVMNAAFWGHLEGAVRGITLCDNAPTETRAIVVKGIIWVIALACVVITARELYKQQLKPT